MNVISNIYIPMNVCIIMNDTLKEQHVTKFCDILLKTPRNSRW